jgi:ATP-dependent DNA helicase DinG
LGLRVSRAQVLYLLRQLATRQGKGLLPAQGADTLLMDLVDVARRETEGFFDELDLWARHTAPPNLRLRTPELFDLRVTETLDRLGEVVQAFADTRQEPEVQLELAARADRCHGTASEIRALVNMAREDHVYWVERGGSDGGNLSLQSAPVEVAPELTEHLWQRLKSVTLTSATLTTGGTGAGDGFGHLAGRLGLSDFTTLQAGTPFVFREQARLIADTRLPDPRDGDAFEDALPDAVLRHVQRTLGHAFVLFTSYQSLDRCHAACASALIQSGYVVLKQGEGMPRGRMLEEFRAAASAVLFGTDSFWQGVDVPGEALQNVIITRLPFSVPTHPLQQARTEAIEQRGGSAFGEYALPQAILKLKQGFGRLIRTRTDTGVVVVLDKRLVTMRYGKQFLAALPDVPLEVQ